MLFSFFSIDAKTKKNLGVNKIVMMIGFLGKFFFFDYEIFFSTPGIDSCAYFFKIETTFSFFFIHQGILFTECLTTTIFFHN